MYIKLARKGVRDTLLLCLVTLTGSLLIQPAEARPRAVQQAQQTVCDNDGRCRADALTVNRTHTAVRGGAVVGSRPAACPRRWCGCGASLHLFGRIIPRLNLAANWLAFPRSAPAPDMAAARRGHVFVLKQHIQGNTWLVYDANSGGGKARMHARSIAGFVIVNPRAG